MLDGQLDMFTHPPSLAQEGPRLSRQCAAILARLRRGPASNRELSQMACKYTSRISDLRGAGYDVRVMRRDRETGLTFYGLAS